LADTEELIANQKPPSAEYKVVKAQIQEQKVSENVGMMNWNSRGEWQTTHVLEFRSIFQSFKRILTYFV